MSNASIFEMTVFSLQFALSPSAGIGYLIVFLIMQPEAFQIFATDMKKWRRDYYPLTMRIGTSLCGGWCAYCWIDKVDQEEMEREIERGPQRERDKRKIPTSSLSAPTPPHRDKGKRSEKKTSNHQRPSESTFASQMEERLVEDIEQEGVEDEYERFERRYHSMFGAEKLFADSRLFLVLQGKGWET